MLKSHANLLDPRPSERLRIGDRVVDIPLREIAPLDGGEPVRVTLKSLGVLMVLVAHAGRLVSREALLEWVWPDTLPTDDVVTQAITQLRRALGDERGRARAIETLPKQGYRLVAPIEWLVDASVSDTEASPLEIAFAPSPAPAGRRTRWPLLAAAAALALGLFAAVQVFEWRPQAAPAAALPSPSAPATAQRLEFQRIASMPAAEERPSLSPDGALVVYTRSANAGASATLMLQTSTATPPRALTDAVPGHYDLMPAWSPDGREIAFVRSGPDRCLVMAIPAAGGSARELGECIDGESHPVAWYPDGKALVGARKNGYSTRADVDKALYRMALDLGRWERIPYTRSTTDEDLSPAVSPDGRWIAFQRNVSLADLWRIPVGGGTPERLTDLRTNIYGLAWTPDSRGLLFTRYLDGKVVLSTLDLGSGRITDHPGGENSFMFPSISAGDGTVAFEVENIRSVARRLALGDGASALGRSEVVFDSTGSNLLPSIAPDGRQVLFVSDRTGDMRLWWQDTTRPDTLRSFEGFIPLPRHPAMWHPDSRRALAIGRPPGGTTGIYEIEPARGRMTRLAVPDGDPVHVAYHPDPDRLLVVADHGEGRLGVTLYDRSAQPWRALGQVADVAVAVVDPRHRRIVLASMSTPEIRSADFALGDVRTIDRVASQRRNRMLVATEEGMRVMDASGCPWFWRLVAAEGAETPARQDGRCLGSKGWWLEGVTYAPASRSVYVSVIQDTQTDIGVAPLPGLDGPDVGDAAGSRVRPVANR
jgi:DNA-binding winged helix-turn-helix (wHTH) protein/Tol biopolymer transport system component